MKQYVPNGRKQILKSNKYATKTITRLLVSCIMFAVIFFVLSLNLSFSLKLKQYISYSLNNSIDINEVAQKTKKFAKECFKSDTAREFFEKAVDFK